MSNTIKSIFFEDNGQPYLQFNLENNEVIEVLPKSIKYFLGCKVDEDDVALNKALILLDKDAHRTITNHRVESIIRI